MAFLQRINKSDILADLSLWRRTIAALVARILLFGETMKIRLLLASATCLALPTFAHAQPVTGPYVSLEAGTSLENPTNASSKQPFSPFPTVQYGTYSGKNQFRPSYDGVAAVGFGFGNGFRIQLDGDYLRNTRHSVDASQPSSSSPYNFHSQVTGGENKYGLMVNGLYDFSVGLPVFPYVGAGVGYQIAKFDSDFITPYSAAFSGAKYSYGGTQGSFAYDLIAGVSYPLPMVPGLSLTGEYRFMQLVQSRNYSFNHPSATFLSASAFNAHVKVGQESSNSFLIGLRYAFCAAPLMAPAPAPAPTVAPAPAPAKTYLVFFDWNKYDLTARATQIIAEAASDSKTTKVTKITVSGNTDTSGTATYNQGLSVRRAKAVAVKLMADGVPASEISIFAYGETHLLVPTGPGVREPQNRRVEIVLK